MREISQLIDDVRFATNETDENRFPDVRLLKFFNDAQDQIEALILIANFENAPLDKRAYITVTPDVDGYNLPSDIYAYSSVSSVRFNNGSKVQKVSASERNVYSDYYTDYTTGYYILGKKIYFTPMPSSTQVFEMIYKAKLPRIEDVADAPNLPAMCDGFMTSFVERKIHAINSSSDVSNSNVFTSEEKEMIIEIFSQNSTDSTEIPDKRGHNVDFEY